MKKVLLILLCMPVFFSCGEVKVKTSLDSSIHQQTDDLIKQFTIDIERNIEASNKKNWDVVIGMTYPKLFDLVSKEELIVVLESVKATDSIKAPFDCVLIENNHELEDDQEQINKDPENTWIIKISEHEA